MVQQIEYYPINKIDQLKTDTHIFFMEKLFILFLDAIDGVVDKLITTRINRMTSMGADVYMMKLYLITIAKVKLGSHLILFRT